MNGDNLTTLRALLFETLRSVKDGSMDIDRARGVNEIAKTLVDTAKVEVDYVRATDGNESAFLGADKSVPALPGRTVVHRLMG
jgi:hypothetical protein